MDDLEKQKLRKDLEEKDKELTQLVEEKKRIQDAFYHQQQDLKALSDNSPDIIARFDRNLQYVYVNQTIEKVTGLPKIAFIGKTNKDLSLSEEQEPYWSKSIEKVFTTGQELRIEFNLQAPGKKMRYFQARLVPEKTHDGSVQYVLGVAHDITELKELDQAKDEFISLVSHELRTPMTAIKGLVSMLLNGDYGEISERIKQPLINAYSSAERQVHLINDLLSISRLQAGRVKYTLSDFSIGSVIKEVVNSFQGQIKQKRITLTVDDGEGIMVQGDDIWIKEILSNLIGNAIKFTINGGVTISYKYEGDQIIVMVTDTGTGISLEDQQKLFGKFSQLITPEMGKAIGSGLGLYIAREISRKLGGDVKLEKSIPGQGSTFVLNLPKAGTAYAENIKKQLEKEMELALNNK